MRKFFGLAAAIVVALATVPSAHGVQAWSARHMKGHPVTKKDGSKAPTLKDVWHTPDLRDHALLAASDDNLVDAVQRAHFEWFRRNQHPVTGLVLDRDRKGAPASIAATGFALTAHTIAAERGWISRGEALKYARKTLASLALTPQGCEAEGRSGNWGMYYHFLDPATGLRATKASKFGWNSELSTIDTALLVAGILSARNYFNSETDTEQQQLRKDANFIVDRVEWDRFLNKKNLLVHAWTPEGGMYDGVYRGYSEALLLYIVALGSKEHAIPSSAWTAFIGDATTTEKYGKTIIGMPGMPLFCYQYPQGFIDFRGINDDVNRRVGFDYHENARRVTQVHHDYAMHNPKKFRGYGPLDWGLTACDGPADSKKEIEGRLIAFRQYSERGGPDGFDDGTIAPTAAMSAMPYEPQLVCDTLRYWLMERPELFDPEKGFVDAFNPTYDTTKLSGWVDSDRIGIDQGPIVIAFENARSEFVWNLMKRDRDIQMGLQRAGFKGGWLDKQLAGAPSTVR